MRRIKGPRVEPTGVHTLLGTAVGAGDVPAGTLEERTGRCFELATYAATFGVTAGEAPKSAFLVHGTIHGPAAERRIAHAWVLLPGGFVWEPVRAKIYDRARWYHWTAARDEATYGHPDATRLLLERGHYGPWHRDPEPVEAAE